MTALLIGVGVVALIVAIAVAQRSGPRVTEITRTRKRERKDKE